MRISAKAEYACLALAELAKPGVTGSPKRARDISEAQGIPERYLVQILLQLKAAGLVQSARGSEGGYLLIRSPDEVSVAEVIAAIDGPSNHDRKSTSPAGQELGELLRRAQSAEQQVLASATIAQLTRAFSSPDWVI
jgi:Rrf2 family protein